MGRVDVTNILPLKYRLFSIWLITIDESLALLSIDRKNG